MTFRNRKAAGTMLSLLLGLFAVFSVSFTGPASATTPETECLANPLGAAKGYTEFIKTNGSRGSESEGAIAYGGNLAAGGMTVGTRLHDIPHGSSYPALVVNGTSNSFNLQKGSAYVPGRTGHVNFNGGGSFLTTAPIDFNAAFTDLVAKSTSWAGQAATGSATVLNTSHTNPTGFTGGNSSLWLKGTDATRNVFSVTAAQLSGLNNVLIDVPAGSTALINVSGTNVQFDGQMWFRNGGWTQAQDSATATFNKNTLWNFAAASGLLLSTGSAFAGTILAPNAHVNAANVGHNIGQVLARSFESNRETHHAPFVGCLPPTDPPDGPTGPTGPTSPTGPTGPTSPTGPTGPTDPGKPKLKITKTADNPVVTDGDRVKFTLTVKNEGDAPSEDTVISDLVPVGLTIDSATAPCTISGQKVQCVVGTLASGQARTYEVVTTARVLTADTANDQLTIGKVEKHVSIQAGQTVKAQINCGVDGIMSDGSVRVDNIDQGTGDLNSLEVHRLESVSESAYEAVVSNHSTGQAQTKLFGVCLPKQTSGGHALLVSTPVTRVADLDSGIHTVNLTCGAGYTPIAPGLDVTGGRAWVVASAPNGATGRKVTLRVDQDNTVVEVSVRCLSNRTGEVNGASSELQFTPITRSLQVGAGQTVSEQLTCGEHAKGIVAGWEYDEELVQAGNDPQPKTRVFKIWNPTGHPLNATLYLLCLEVRTGTPGGDSIYVNTAQVNSSSNQAPGAELSGDASVTVGPAPPPAAPAPPAAAASPAAPAPPAASAPQGNVIKSSAPAPAGATLAGRRLKVKLSAAGIGKVRVVSPHRFRVGKRVYRKASLLGRGVSAGRSTITVKLRKPAAKAIKAGRVKRVKVTVTSGKGTARTKVLRVKRR
ncbi:MAG: choice-of-anchor A family protein [Actinomycetota bacterium]|nr:choice-of-anchor A family protein [Actinomycetota bacterium]